MSTNSKSVLIRLDEDKLNRFHNQLPWHGSFVHFVRQALDEYLELTEGRPGMKELTKQAVHNVVKREY